MATQTGSIDLKAAKAAADIAENTSQYFWFNSTASGTEGAGAHITEVDSATFISDPANGGGNVLINSGSIAVRDGTTNLASFGSSGATIGQTGGAHSVIDANGQRFYATDGTTQLANIGYGSGASQGGGTATAPYYSFGRRTTPGIGNYSVAEGLYVVASGFCSHAEGYGSHDDIIASGEAAHAEGRDTAARGDASHVEGNWSEAIGNYSHAQNTGTVAGSANQTTLGKYNIRDDQDTYAVIIGNGTADTRSNALTVDWSGNVAASGKVTGTNTVSEEGTSGDWTYRKWASGKAEAWGTLSASSAAFTATGSVYYRSLTSQAFPTSLFNAAPRVTATVEMSNIGGTTVQNVTSSTFTVNVMSAVATARALTIYVYAVGTWQ